MQPFHPYQSHLPATRDSPAYEKESHFGPELAARRVMAESDIVVREYEQHRDELGKAIEQSKYLIAGLKNFNGDAWIVQYPVTKVVEGPPTSRPGSSRRTITFIGQPTSTSEAVITSTTTGPGALKRSVTAVPPSPAVPIVTVTSPNTPSSHAEPDDEDFSILRLNLNAGAIRHAENYLSHLEKSSISALLDTRFSAALEHLTLLQKRIYDPQSRVLITGDLNAGKSTLINALLRRNEVMPTDEQPLTTRFVEVVSARQNNEHEEIHVLHKEAKYDPSDRSTYSIESVEKLEEMVTDMETDASSPPVRVFLREAMESSNPSILHNGVVDISLIDAPGLNRDSVKTTANFARQEEIDVVVFVVSAANHFTLSAKEFIWQAGQEKAHLFIVVNRFDQIKDKARCRRVVLEQIKQLSPKTYEDAADLVHFVDSAKVAFGFSDQEAADDVDEAFSQLEHSLRSFVLVNRSKSKLGPARNYVIHLLGDVELLAAANSLVATRERDEARAEINRVKPVLEKMNKGKEILEENLLTEEETVTEQTTSRTKKAMERALERVGLGEMAAPAPSFEMPSYPGLLGVWDYAQQIKKALLASLDFAVTLAEQDTRRLTTDGVARISEIGDKHLPADVERSKRIFNPKAMFSVRPPSSRHTSSVSAVGLSLATQNQLVDVNVSDIFDLQYHVSLFRSQIPSNPPTSPSRDLIPFSAEISGLGIASLAFSAFSMAGGKAFGLRPFVEGAIRISDFASNPAARRWIAPVVGLFAVGTMGYLVYELPRSIPRNVGRHLQATLLISSGAPGDGELVPFAEWQSLRVRKETRKVMRLAGWDLRERFKSAADERGAVVKESERKEKSAIRALEQMNHFGEQADLIRELLPSSKP